LKAKTTLFETAGARVADGIVREARKWRADLIVMGTHGRRGFGRMVPGGDAEEVLRETRGPVLPVRSPAPKKPPIRK
jgi:nucleotide-binding universal stress UspA family protein